LVLEYYFQLEDNMRDDVQAHVALSHIILQILEARRELATKAGFLERLENLTGGDSWKDEDPIEPCTVLKGLLSDIPCTYIILDRIDRCSCSARRLFERLLDIADGISTVVKVFIILGESQNLSVADLWMDHRSKVYGLELDQSTREALH
jgi:hypothetical protein